MGQGGQVLVHESREETRKALLTAFAGGKWAGHGAGVRRSILSSFLCMECGRRPSHQMAARLYLFITFGPWVDDLDSILLVYIKWIFLLGVHGVGRAAHRQSFPVGATHSSFISFPVLAASTPLVLINMCFHPLKKGRKVNNLSFRCLGEKELKVL